MLTKKAIYAPIKLKMPTIITIIVGIVVLRLYLTLYYLFIKSNKHK